MERHVAVRWVAVRQVGQGKVWFDGVRSVGLRRVGQGKVRSVRAGYDQLGHGMSVAVRLGRIGFGWSRSVRAVVVSCVGIGRDRASCGMAV